MAKDKKLDSPDEHPNPALSGDNQAPDPADAIDQVHLPEPAGGDESLIPDKPVPSPSQLPDEVFRPGIDHGDGHFEFSDDGQTVVWRTEKKHWWDRVVHPQSTSPAQPLYHDAAPDSEEIEVIEATAVADNPSIEAAPVATDASTIDQIYTGDVEEAVVDELPATSGEEYVYRVADEQPATPRLPWYKRIFARKPAAPAPTPAASAPLYEELPPSEAQPELPPAVVSADQSEIVETAPPELHAPAPVEASLAPDAPEPMPWAEQEAAEQAQAQAMAEAEAQRVVAEPIIVAGGNESDATSADQRRRQRRLKKEAARVRREARKQKFRDQIAALKGKVRRDPLDSARRAQRIGGDRERESLIEDGVVEGENFSVDPTSDEAIADITAGIAAAGGVVDQESHEMSPEEVIANQAEEEKALKKRVKIEPKDDLDEEENFSDDSPPVKLLRKLFRQHGDIMGVDIGARHIRVAHVRDGQLLLLASRALPPGLFEDSLLVEPELFSREMAILWKEASIPSKRINFSVLNRQVAMRLLELKAEEREDLQMAIVMNADDVLAPINTETATIDYSELSRSAAGVSVQLAAAEKPMVRELIKASEKAPAKLLASGCEISILAAARALAIPRYAREAHMLVDVGAQTTGIICASGRDIFFLRVVDIGGDDFTRAIAESCGTSFERAEYVKMAIGLDPAAAAGDIGQEERSRAQTAMIKMADRLCDEINRTREFYLNQPGGREVKGITLIGGGSRLVGLNEQIKLYSGVGQIDPAQPIPSFMGVQDIDLYATAIGLAIQQNMSLLPDADALNFSVAAPGSRRRSKVSSKRHKERVRASGIGQRKQKTISPKTLTIFGVVAALGFCYWAGQMYFKGQNESLKPEVESAKKSAQLESTAAQVPQYTKTDELPNPDLYNAPIQAMRVSPNMALTAKTLAVLASAQASDVTVQSAGPSALKVQGKIPDGQSLETLTAELEKIDGAIVPGGIEKGSAVQGSQGFKFVVQVPIWRYEP